MSIDRPLTTTTKPPRTNWSIATSEASKKLYRLAVINQNAGIIPTAVGTFYVDEHEYEFLVNPQGLDCEETIAVNITPTQDGGQFIEHQGSLYKNVTITGTTGVRPNKKEGPIRSFWQWPPPSTPPVLDPATGLPFGEKSGFDLLVDLRNFFRNYFDIKRNPNKAANHVMVWENVKDAEFYVVEPTVFRVRRDASSPVTYNYEIQLRTIQPLDLARIFQQIDTRTLRNSTKTWYQRLGEMIRSMADAISTLNQYLDILQQGISGYINTIVMPAIDVLNAITGLNATASRGLGIPRSYLQLLTNNVVEAIQSFQGYASQIRSYGPTKNSIYSSLANACKQLQRNYVQLYNETSLFSNSSADVYERRVQAYSDPRRGDTLPITGGSKTYMANSSVPAGTTIARVQSNDTIYSVAKRYLGDQAQWKEIVLVNNLKPPYISPNGDGKAVLRPGDYVLYPTRAPQGSPNIVDDEKKQQTQGALISRLGRDIRVTSDTSLGGDGSCDFKVGTNGDIELIDGMDNLEQAIKLKFSTERGTLPTHPYYGLQSPVGSKAILRSLVAFQIDVRGALLADNRIASVKSVNFNMDGNVLSVNADVQVADVDQSISISYEARR